MGLFAGYYSARIYKMFKGRYWLRCILLTAIAYPLIILISFLFVNMFLAFEESSGAVINLFLLINHYKIKFSKFFMIVSLWFGISVPLVFLGSFVGFKREIIKNPTGYHMVPKLIKKLPWYLNRPATLLLGGLLPFGAFFIEL